MKGKFILRFYLFIFAAAFILSGCETFHGVRSFNPQPIDSPMDTECVKAAFQKVDSVRFEKYEYVQNAESVEHIFLYDIQGLGEPRKPLFNPAYKSTRISIIEKKGALKYANNFGYINTNYSEAEKKMAKEAIVRLDQAVQKNCLFLKNQSLVFW